MDRLLAINLLIKLGVAAAVASVLVRSRKFKQLVFTEQRTVTEKLHLVLFIGMPLAMGVVIRVATPSFAAADIAFEGAILMGVMGGYIAGVAGGLLLGLPAAIQGEWLSIPMWVFAGVLAGALRNWAKDREVIWSFSPFIDLSIYRWVRRNLPWPKFDWQITFFVVIVALRLLQMELHRAFPQLVYSADSDNFWMLAAIYAASVMTIAIPMKIWNNARMEMKLEEQQRLLLHARMEALQNQINPHFLFNTLNSVSSLVRFDPDTAREIIVKLSHILRRLLRQSDSFVDLREEVQFIDDYLDIEVVRFGRDKLKVVKDLQPESLDVMVPSMLLQPLVENSIKHGLSPKIEGGTIHIRSRLANSELVLEVEDDGVGMGSANLLEPRTGIGGSGIGMANVAERLRVLYGDAARMVVNNSQSGGTQIQLHLPLIQTVEQTGEPAGAARGR